MKFESFNQPENNDSIKNAVKDIQDLYIGLAERHLPEDNPLRMRVIEYYSDTPRLEEELSVVFKDATDETIKSQLREAAKKFEDRTLFIEYYQKIFERTDTF